MTEPQITPVLLSTVSEDAATEGSQNHDAPLLITGNSLGTSTKLWAPVVALLGDSSGLAGSNTQPEVIGFDLPGHGVSPDANEDFTLAELAAAVLTMVDKIRPGAQFYYAGDSISGAIALELALAAPGRLRGISVICSAALISTPESWAERAEMVAQQGTPALIQGSLQRWFAPGFVAKQPELVSDLLHDLSDTDRYSYVRCCQALAQYDVRARLPEITVPTLVISGAQDAVTPPAAGAEVVEGIRAGGGKATQVVLKDAAHQAPVEKPQEVAELLQDLIAGEFEMEKEQQS